MRIALALVAMMLLAGCAEDPAAPTSTPTTTGGTPASPTSTPTATIPTPTVPTALPTPEPLPPTAETCNAPFSPLDLPASAPSKPRIRMKTTLGDFTIELEPERAPATSQNFLDLAQSGFYNGTLFHRVIPEFVIQGGDPLSKDEEPGNDGTGGSGVTIPDEFNPTLRHDRAGILSMANSGPNSGSSQFFVTLGATPHLDDRHAVFGRVTEGMEVVQSISGVQTQNERPVQDVRLLETEILAPVPIVPEHEIDVHVVIPTKTAEAGRPVRFAVIAQNKGNVRETMAISASVPPGWTCKVDTAAVVPAGTGKVFFLQVTPAAGAKGAQAIEVRAARASAPLETVMTPVEIQLTTFGPAVKDGDRVTANYAGLLPDGRLFDTSMASVGMNADQPKFVTVGGWRDRTTFSPFPFTVGGREVITGFSTLARTAKVGETVTGLLPAKDAYAVGSQYQQPLTGRDLIFELEIARVG